MFLNFNFIRVNLVGKNFDLTNAHYHLISAHRVTFYCLKLAGIDKECLFSTVPREPDCQFSHYGDWSKCSVDCGFGFQERRRLLLSFGLDSDCSQHQLTEKKLCKGTNCGRPGKVINDVTQLRGKGGSLFVTLCMRAHVK